MSLSIKRSRRRKMSSIAGFTSHAISPPAPDTTRASRALAVTACQCGLSDRSRRPRTRYRELTRGGGAARGDECSSTPFDATLAKPVRLFKLRSVAAATAWYSAASEALFMCGIAGVLLRRGSPDEGALRRMGDALAHRGPDDLGVHVAGPLGLLQTRLSIIDLEGGHQPMADGPLTLVANGEIYNFVELRQALEARGRRFATHSDSETILHAYALDGLGALPSLNGMFAFALYDGGRRPQAPGAPVLVAARRPDAPARVRPGRRGIRAAVPPGDARAPARRRPVRLVPVERSRLGRAASDDDRAHRPARAHVLHRLSRWRRGRRRAARRRSDRAPLRR